MIDAYVKIRFCGYKAKTRPKRSQSPEWNEEFFLPVLVPSIGVSAVIEVRDRDDGPTDEYVDTFTISLDAVLKGGAPSLAWYPLFGLGGEAAGLGDADTLSAMRAAVTGNTARRRDVRTHLGFFASEWRGKLLLSLGIERQRPNRPLTERVHKRPITWAVKPLPTASYELRAVALAASGLWWADEDAEKQPTYYFEAAIEEHLFRTEAVTPLRGSSYASMLPSEHHGDSFHGVFGRQSGLRDTSQPSPPLRLAEASKDLPEVIVYFCTGRPGGGKRRGFVRFCGAELHGRGQALSPSWIVFRPMAPLSTSDRESRLGRPLPAVLLSIALVPHVPVAAPAKLSFAGGEPRTPGTTPSTAPRLPQPSCAASTASHMSPPTSAALATANAELRRYDSGCVAQAPSPVSWPPPVPAMLPFRPNLRAYEVRLSPSPRDALPSPLCVPNSHPFDMPCGTRLHAQVRLHLFQGRQLPAADANGVLDAFVVASIGGVRLQGGQSRDSTAGTARNRSSSLWKALGSGGSTGAASAVCPETAFPIWNETMRATAWLPPLSFAPQVTASC